MAMTNEQLTKWIDEIFGTIDEIKQNSGDISGLTRSVRQLREDLTATQEDVSDLETDTAGTVSLAKAQLQHFTDGSATQALDLVADIIPVQAGSGDPSPTNVRAISGFSSVTATAAGKNILDFKAYLDYARTVDDRLIYNISDGVYTVNNNSYLAPITYYFSEEDIAVTLSLKAEGNGGAGVYLILVDSSGAEVTRANISTSTDEFRTISVSGSASGFIVSYANSGGMKYTEAQLELNTTATPYEAYQANTTTFSLGSTVYSGTVNFTTGELTIDKIAVDLGSFTWLYNATWGAHPAFYISTALENCEDVSETDIPDALCSVYKIMSRSYLYDNESDGLCIPNNAQVSVRDSRFSDPDELKTALSGQKLVYKLATPITTTLTPAQLQLLQGENNVSVTSGPITLTYAPDNVLAEVYAYIQKRFDTFTASLAANRTTRKTTKTLTKKED